jgi:hypothetical protein
MALLLALLAGLRCVADSPAAYKRGDDSAVIYVARRGWHMDIGFAAVDLQPPLKLVAAQFGDVRYVFFGFGDAHYLKSKNHSTPTMLAALWPGPGLILATGLSSTPQEAFGIPHVIALAVTSRQSGDAQTFVWRSLSVHDDASPAYAAGPYPGSLYFTATPRYSALHTCNTWAAESLAAAELPITSAGVLFAGQLWRQALRLQRYRQGGLDPSWQTTVVDDP